MLHGIPERECTPRVREAIAALSCELDRVRHDLDLTRQRLELVERAADEDHLLPVLNRRAFARALRRQIAAVERYETPVSLIYLDLNGFKQVNDRLGHAAGDAALRHLANLLVTGTRASDAVGRLGGDEFGILLSHADRTRAEAKAHRLAEALVASPLSWNGLCVPIRFSFGVFELASGDDAEAAIARADAAMYARKRREENSACVHGALVK